VLAVTTLVPLSRHRGLPVGYHTLMSVTTRDIEASPERIFDVLRDGWSYASWVVGASCIRAVDDTWPAHGSKLHHSVGAWPALISDSTEVEEVDAPRRLQLRARAWPSGEARVRFDIEPTEAGSRVTITENVIAGPARLVPDVVENGFLHKRNTESLRRLAYLVERGNR